MLICRYLKAFIISKIEHYDLLHAIHNYGSEFWKNKEETKKKNHTEFCQKYSLVFILPDMFTFIYSFNTFLLSLGAMHYSRFCSCSVATSCPTLCNHMDRSTPGLPVHHHLLEFAQIHVHWVSDTIQPSSSAALFSFCLQSFSSVFSSESALHIRRPKYWSFSISPSNEYSGLISLRIDWFDLLAVQGTLRVFSNTTIESISSSVFSLLYDPTLIHTWLLEKP